MPPIIGLVLLGAGVVAGYRAFQMAASHFRDEFDKKADGAKQAADARDGSVPMKDLGALEFDPNSGVYRPTNG